MNAKLMAVSLVLTAFFSFHSVLAQGLETVSLEQAVQEAIRKNYSVKIASKNLETVEKEVTMGNAGMLPSVNLDVSHRRSLNDTRSKQFDGTEVTFTSKDRNTSASVGLNYTFYDGLAMFYRYDALKNRVILTDIERRREIEGAVSSVIVTYLDALSADQRIKVARESFIYSRERLDQIRRRVKAGSATELDALNAEVSLAEDSITIIQTQQARISAVKNLLYLMGRQAYADDIRLASDLELMSNLKEVDLRADFLLKNTLVSRANANEQLTLLDYKTFQAARHPQIFFRGGLGWSRNSNNGNAFNQFREGFGPSGTIGLSFNVFDGGKRNNRVQRGRLEVENRQLQKQEAINLVSKDFQVALENYQISQKLLLATEDILPRIIKNYENSKRSYDLGIITNIELRQAQLNLVNFKNRINEARIDLKRAEVELLRLSGRLVE